jgi:hypothetical protein
MNMIFRHKTKAIETLNLTIADSQEPQEFKPKLSNSDQRKLYRDELTPLTDEEKKYHPNGVSKRIIIAPILRLSRRKSRPSLKSPQRLYATLDTIDKLEGEYYKSFGTKAEESDIAEMHVIYKNNANYVALSQTCILDA